TGIVESRSPRRPGHRIRSPEPIIELLLSDHTALYEAGGGGGEPVLVVGRGQVPRWVHPLDRVPEPPKPPAQVPRQQGGDRESVRAAFPVGVEDGFVRLDLDWAESLHPAEVVHAIHGHISPRPATACLTKPRRRPQGEFGTGGSRQGASLTRHLGCPTRAGAWQFANGKHRPA